MFPRSSERIPKRRGKRSRWTEVDLWYRKLNICAAGVGGGLSGRYHPADQSLGNVREKEKHATAK